MFCEKCGKELPADARFCEHCGNPVTRRKAFWTGEKTGSGSTG